MRILPRIDEARHRTSGKPAEAVQMFREATANRNQLTP
jgi:hypothetical protein